MERQNNIVNLATKKLSKILDVEVLEAAHQVQQLRTHKLDCLLSKNKNITITKWQIKKTTFSKLFSEL